MFIKKVKFSVRYLSLLVASLLVLIIAGCEKCDNQMIIPAEFIKLANPIPTNRLFSENNSNHKVLIGVIDSGVDYNHNYLVNNIHFNLDSDGIPVSFGYDYTGNDSWASPYIVRTGYVDKEASQSRIEESLLAKKNYEIALKLAPELSSYIEPGRAPEQERNSGSYHGTHVAGLAVYDRNDIGLIGYRILPKNIIGQSSSDTENLETVALRVNESIELAAKQGVKIINMSLGFSSKISDSNYEKIKTLSEKFANVVQSHPDILFVVAAGNDGGWIDGESRINFPCSIKKDNILCVGSLRSDNKVSDYSNIVLNGAEIVFSLGEEVLSTVPNKMCPSSSIEWIADDESEEQIVKHLARAKEDCGKFKGLDTLSGTSMASPITARLSAIKLIENPSATPKQIIELLKKDGVASRLGEFPIIKLKVEKPSWYKTSPLNFDSGEAGDYWEAYTPKK